VADVAVRCLQRPAAFGQVLTLTGPEAHSLPELAALLSELQGRPVRYSALPAWVAQLLLPFVSGMPRWQSNQVVALFRALERGAQAQPSPDVQRVLGRPARRAEDFLAEHAETFGGARNAPLTGV
jgi:uncharacterized protein YbjT (DUF2867 family)